MDRTGGVSGVTGAADGGEVGVHDWGSSRVPGCGDVRERKVTVRCIGAALRGGRHTGRPRWRVLEG